MIGHRTHQLLVSLLVIALTATPALAAAEYSLTGSSAIEIPSQTTNYKGEQLTIDSVTRIGMDDLITLTTAAPPYESYYLQLRNPDNHLVLNWRVTGNTTRTINYFGNAGAGTYVASLKDGEQTVAIHPIVRSGYDVTVDVPSSVEVGESATITATVTELPVEKHSTMQRVEVVIGNDSIQKHVVMSKQDDGTYAATIDTADLATTDHAVYVIVRGDETVVERSELLGISDTASLTITEPQPDPETQTQPTETPTETMDTSSDDTSSDGSAESQLTDTPIEQPSSNTRSAPATEQSNVIDPSSGGAEPTEDPVDGDNQLSIAQPGSGLNTLALAIVLGAILTALLVVRKRD